MKKLLISLSALAFISMIFSNCKENGVGFTPINNTKYPAKLDMEWEYNSLTISEYYDSTGNIINTDTIYSDNSIVKVVSINETLGSYTNLIKLESYDISTPENKSFHWYSNSDSGLVAVAYTNAGSSQLVYPKIKLKKYLTADDYKSIINSPVQNFFSVPDGAVSDSIQYYETPRKVLAYPLMVNQRWTELIVPWYRERYVDEFQNINFNGQQLNCYVIKIDWPSFRYIELNDYVNLNTGLVKREILADSIMFTTVTNPDSGDFGRISTISNLVRIKPQAL